MQFRNANKNSWIVSLLKNSEEKISHNYFCQCSHRFTLKTKTNQIEAPDVLCPLCGNDYFLDSKDFTSKDGVQIYKDFYWDNDVVVTNETWRVTLYYTIEKYIEASDAIVPVKQNLLTLELNKNGKTDLTIIYHLDIVSRYSLFKDDRVMPLKTLLLDDAKENLCNVILNNRIKAIEWINEEQMQTLSTKEKIEYLRFFLQHENFKEHEFFFWKLEGLDHIFSKFVTQKEALHLVLNERKEKSVKKALYQGYNDAMKKTKYYYPYSDYVFSRTIDNINLLTKLYALHPVIKQNLFTSDTLSEAIELIKFLKNHYIEKQIVNLFTKDIQAIDAYKERLLLFRDTLSMLDVHNATVSLEQHFMKVKLTAKKLHDEIIRVFHIVSYELDAKEEFEYDPIYLSACQEYEGLEFRLPLTVKELSLWAKLLHNCMFGYIKRIHQHKSIIYGIFKDDELLYAIELNGFRLVQARGVSNSVVPSIRMNVINGWKSNILG